MSSTIIDMAARLGEQLDVDYVINARHTAPSSLLIEQVHSGDGQHAWVELYDEPARSKLAGRSSMVWRSRWRRAD